MGGLLCHDFLMAEVIRVSNNSHFAGIPYRLLQNLPFVDYREGTPYQNACRLHEREADLSLIPIYDYFSHGGYAALDFGMGCRQKSGSMMLYAERPIEELRRIYIYSSSRTSLALLRILLRVVWKSDPQIIRQQRHSIFDMVKGESGALSMHDKPGTLENRFPISIDLIQAWHHFAKAPMPLLTWAYRPGTLSLAQINQLNEAFYKGDKIKSDLARELAAEYELDEKDALEFVGENRRYYFDTYLQNGVERFRELAVQFRILPATTWSPARRTIQDDAVRDSISPRSIQDIRTDLSADLPISITDLLTLAEHCRLDELRTLSLQVESRTFTRGVSTTFAAGNDVSLDAILSSAGWERELDRLKAASNEISFSVSLDDILSLSHRLSLSSYVVASQLISSGLRSVSPGSGVPLIEAKFRNEGMPFTPTEWFDLAAVFQSLGYETAAALRADQRDTWEERVVHLEKIRSLAIESGAVSGLRIAKETAQAVDEQTVERIVCIATIFTQIPMLQEAEALTAVANS